MVFRIAIFALLLQCFILLVSSLDGIQIITPTEVFLDGLSDQIHKWSMNDVGWEYQIVAIMGSQSSGKSTLLNNLFGTDFPVMNPEEHSRTTNGAWLSQDRTQNIIVMDVEGSDSNARGGDQNFERKVALFALTCSSVLIVNMREHQVGLYAGANLDLLRVIFEEYLELFGNSDRPIYDRPQIFFIIQAHTGTTSLESLAKTLTKDLMGIWQGLAKPDKLRDIPVTEYFKFEFDSLPHLVLDSENYKKRVNTVRKRFVERGSEGYIFEHASSNTVPLDGLEPYMRATWEKIHNNEKLNLPGQRELIARVMCDKISASLLKAYEPLIMSTLTSLDDGKILEAIRPTMQSWRDDILMQYDKGAGRYAEHNTFMEKRISLGQSFHMEVWKVYDKQLKNVRHSLLSQFGRELEDAMAKDEAEFTSFVSYALSEYERRFEEAAKKYAMDETEWEWTGELKELQNALADWVRARKRDRATPITATRTSSVGFDKEMTTTATLYRDGRLIVEISTSCDHIFLGLRGRALIAVRDADAKAIGVTEQLRCTTRGGIFNVFTSSSGKDVFSLEFPPEMARRAVGLDIWQSSDEGTLGNVLSTILMMAQDAIPIARFISPLFRAFEDL